MAQRRTWLTAVLVALACGDHLTAPAEDTLLRINGFTTTVIDTSFNSGYATALARDASGALHISHMGDTNSALKYATCAAACDTPAGWTTNIVDQGLYGYAPFTWIEVDDGGRVHIGYSTATGATAVVRYATCSAVCTFMPA